jgi:hypothetical protein
LKAFNFDFVRLRGAGANLLVLDKNQNIVDIIINKRFTGGVSMKKYTYDILVAGGSLGGIMAAYSAAKEGKKVLLVETTDWIGGQLTSQAVPPDEHRWIEQFGCTKTYRKYRNRVRQFYKENYPMKVEEVYDPGNSSVSRLAHEPRIALHLLNEMLLPYISNGSLTVLLNHIAVRAEADGDIIKTVWLRDSIKGVEMEVEARYFIDGTDIGDLIKLTGTEYTSGAESREETGEPHALESADREDMQPVTWVAAVDYVEGENHTVQKPKDYELYRNMMQPYDNYPVLSWYGPDSSTGKAKKFGMFDDSGEGLFPLWSYRRIVFPDYYRDGFQKTEVTLINWPQNDYFMGNIFDNAEVEKHMEAARQLTLSFIYWLQTEAPRTDGGKGYPGIRMRGDITGTEDGLAKAPYIRESRRIKAQYTVKEQDINANCRDTLPKFKDTVGVGCYHIDLHITTRTNTFMYQNSWPFEIPLGAMIPVRVKNLIPGCKNIGTTHLTNGCFRLHPVEWNIGEVAGYLAAQSMDLGVTPAEIRNDEELLGKFQDKLIQEGIELHWPEDKVHVI